MDLIYFILCAYGLTQILLYGSMFNRVRPSKDFLGGLGKLFHCAICMGFWVGFSLAILSPFCSLWHYEPSIVNLFIMGCISSGTSYVLNRMINDDGISVSLNKNE